MHVAMALDQLVPGVPGGHRLGTRDTDRLGGADDQVGSTLRPHDVSQEPVARHHGVGVGAGDPCRRLRWVPQRREPALDGRIAGGATPMPGRDTDATPQAPTTSAERSVQPSRATTTDTRYRDGPAAARSPPW